MNHSGNISAIILAGGKSSRMGEDKGLMLLNNTPMITPIIKLAEWFADEIIIVSNQSGYDQFGYPVVEDLIKESGPLAGIHTGLENITNQKSIVLSCDVPFVSKELLQFVIDASEGYDVTIPEKNGKTHQIIGVYDKSISGFIKEELERGQRKIKLALEKLNLNVIDANVFDQKLFTNLNSREDIIISNVMEVKLFGMLAEAAGQSEIKLEGEIGSVEQLKELVLNQYPQLESMNFKVAVNQSLVEESQNIGTEDEIALLPPFAGG